jgi:hypothetical protein
MTKTTAFNVYQPVWAPRLYGLIEVLHVSQGNRIGSTAAPSVGRRAAAAIDLWGNGKEVARFDLP